MFIVERIAITNSGVLYMFDEPALSPFLITLFVGFLDSYFVNPYN